MSATGKKRLRHGRRRSNRGTRSTFDFGRPCRLPWRSGRRRIVRCVSVPVFRMLVARMPRKFVETRA
jgi:hypothetical protein